MKYIIGIDGGGTKTHCVLTNLNNEILYECTGGPSNFLMLGEEKVCDTLFSLINECKAKIKFDFPELGVVLLGTTGAGRRPDAERLEKSFNKMMKESGIDFEFRVESDARIAVEGAFSGKPGSILIAGTGSIMFGKDADGNIHRVGGFGRFIGDEGSGYIIGKKGLTAAAKDFDGRGKPTKILRLLSEKFKIVSPEILITEIYKNNFDIAAAAPLVLIAAEEGDSTAFRILDEESDELVAHIATMAHKIKEEVLRVAFIGGIISNENIYSKLLHKKIEANLPNVKVMKPEHSPEMGAIFMAKEILAAKEQQ